MKGWLQEIVKSIESRRSNGSGKHGHRKAHPARGALIYHMMSKVRSGHLESEMIR
jgi:hypothetical protein